MIAPEHRVGAIHGSYPGNAGARASAQGASLPVRAIVPALLNEDVLFRTLRRFIFEEVQP